MSEETKPTQGANKELETQAWVYRAVTVSNFIDSKGNVIPFVPFVPREAKKKSIFSQPDDINNEFIL